MKYIVEANEYVQMISLIGVCDGMAITITGNVDTFQNADNELDEAYKKGLEEGKARNENGCVGCKYDNGRIDHSPCDYCCNAYSNQWIAKEKSDEIKIGEEVITPNKKRAIVIDVDVIKETNATIVKVLKGTYMWWYKISELTKIGRYFPQIEELFKAMEEGVE